MSSRARCYFSRGTDKCSEADGILFDLADIEGARIKNDAEYEGVRLRVPASLEEARVIMQIDVGFGDLVDPPPGPPRPRE